MDGAVEVKSVNAWRGTSELPKFSSYNLKLNSCYVDTCFLKEDLFFFSSSFQSTSRKRWNLFCPLKV